MVRTERLELSHLAAPEPKSGVSTNSTTSAYLLENGVDNGARTHDRRNHNPELYQLSYAHHNILYTDNGTPTRTRTWNLRLRRALLYPVEL